MHHAYLFPQEDGFSPETTENGDLFFDLPIFFHPQLLHSLVKGLFRITALLPFVSLDLQKNILHKQCCVPLSCEEVRVAAVDLFMLAGKARQETLQVSTCASLLYL